MAEQLSQRSPSKISSKAISNTSEDLLRRFTPLKKSKNTTKQCQCGNTQLALIQTQNLKWCPDCGIYIDWIKDEGQDDYY